MRHMRRWRGGQVKVSMSLSTSSTTCSCTWMRTGRGVRIRAGRWRVWRWKAQATVPRRLRSPHPSAQEWRRSTSTHSCHTTRTTKVVLHSHGRQRIVVLVGSTSSVGRRLVNVLGQEGFETLYGGEFLNHIALEATACSISNGDQPVGTETQFQAVYCLVC